jgi:hypothetical protein
MKKFFKLMAMAFVASTLLVACGDKDDEDGNGVNDGKTYTITVSVNDPAMGTVTGGGKYDEGATATIEATANAGYTFVQWNDGNKNNPRVITVTGDAEYTANFAALTGVKVNFGSTTWDAEYINGQCASSAYMIAAAQTDLDSYPWLILMNMAGAPAVGTVNGDASITNTGASHGNVYLDYYSDSERGVALGETNVGDWWGMNLVVNVSAFDADALTISLVANAEMWDVAGIVYDGITDVANLNKKNFTMTANGVELAAVKSIFSRNVSGKFVRK